MISLLNTYWTRLFGGFPSVFWWLWLSTLINWLGRFVVPFMALYLTQEMKLEGTQVGIIISLFGAGGLISVFVGGALSDRIGRKTTIVASHLMSAIAMCLIYMAATPYQIAVLMFCLGLVGNAAEPATKALIADILPLEMRQRGYAANMWAVNLGYAVGPMLGAALTAYSFALIFIANATVILLTALIIFIFIPNNIQITAVDNENTDQPDGFRFLIKDKLFLLFIGYSFLFSLIYIQSTISLPIILSMEGFSATDYGLLLSLNGLMLIIIQMPAADFLSRFKRPFCLAISGLIVGIGFGSHMLAHTIWAYMIGVVIWTIAEVMNMPLVASVTADLAPRNLRGRYMGTFMATWSASSLVAPLIAGPIIQHAGPEALWTLCIGLGVICFVGRSLMAKKLDARLQTAVFSQYSA